MMNESTPPANGNGKPPARNEADYQWPDDSTGPERASNGAPPQGWRSEALPHGTETAMLGHAIGEVHHNAARLEALEQTMLSRFDGVDDVLVSIKRVQQAQFVALMAVRPMRTMMPSFLGALFAALIMFAFSILTRR